MKAVKLAHNIYWVGAIDWDLRDFHGYRTHRGSTYNAYLIVDKKITLIDTVKKSLSDEMISRIKSVIDPRKIDYIISNHSEMDHSGAISDVLEYCKKATVICSKNGEMNLKKHFDCSNWKLKVLNTNDELNIGENTLKFIWIQMVHWPDSMATYLEEKEILFPNDAFGQHLASFERYADEIGYDIVIEEAKKYFANIFLPYPNQASLAIEAIENLPLKMIAPSHGLIWRDKIDKILSLYKKWDRNETKKKAIIIYDSMWGSTSKIAKVIYEAFEEKNYHVEIKFLKTNHISDIMTHLIDAKYICIGSPTLNNTCLPTIASFLNYIKGLKPQNRLGLIFGSYGWGGHAAEEIEKIFNELKYPIIENIKFQYVPTEKDLKEIKEKIKEKID